MINPDVIAIVRMNEPTVFFDLYGEEIIPEFPPDIYFNSLRIGENWYGTRNQRLYKLDADFNVMDSYLSDSIRYIRQILNSRIIVGSNSGIEVVDTFFNEIAHTDIIGKSADASDTEVWIIGFEGLYLLDSTLEVIKLFPSIPLERMKTVDVFLDEAFVLSEYEGLQHKDFVIRKYSGKDTVIPVSLDLTIESIQLPDKIIRELWNGLSYAYTLYFDSISFTVRNNGNHPIESCNINYDWDTEVWCHGNYGEWQFDSLNIMPNETKLLTVYDYISGVIYYSVDNPLCFWVDHPNRTPDTDPANNSFCEYANIIISTEYVEEGGIKLFPNPASDYISITSEYQTGQTINMTNVYGRQVLNTHIESPSTQINICGLVNGLYIVSVGKKLFRLMVIK